MNKVHKTNAAIIHRVYELGLFLASASLWTHSLQYGFIISWILFKKPENQIVKAHWPPGGSRWPVSSLVGTVRYKQCRSYFMGFKPSTGFSIHNPLHFRWLYTKH